MLATVRGLSGVLVTLAIVCAAGCSNPLKPRIDAESRKVAQAKDRFTKIRQEVEVDLKKEPDLFHAANVTAAWRDRFQTDQEKLNDAFTDLEKLNHHDTKLSLFSDVERLRDAAVADAATIQTEANRWLDLKRNTAAHLDRMKADYEKIESADISHVQDEIEKAETDWPAKKTDLAARLDDLKSAPEKAEKIWADVPVAQQKPDYAALMTDEKWLDAHAAAPDNDLQLVGQLYNSKDVVLENLDKPRGNDSTCRADVKIIQTHFTDVQDHQSATTPQNKSEDLPESQCESLQNDIGMEIEHKPAGAYDTEVQQTPQPPGFSYLAPPGQSNQYGYWQNQNGNSVWTWLPQYLILRELLWNHNYIPIPAYEYEGYWSARRAGTTYYGGGYPGGAYPGSTYSSDRQVQAAPKYGTHGTFTTQTYAGSRYKNQGGSFGNSQYKNQGGGYRSSGYANGQSAEPSSSAQHGNQFGRTPSSSSQGKRFGSPSSRPRSMPSGRRYGRR